MDNRDYHAVLKENEELKKELYLLRNQRESGSLGWIQSTLKRFDEMFRFAPIGYVLYDHEGQVLNGSKFFLNCIGVSEENIIGLNMLGTIKDEKLRKAISDSIETGSGYFEGEYKSALGRKNIAGRGFFYRFLEEDGRFCCGIGLLEDLSQNERARKAIKVAEAAYRALFYGFQDAIYIQDAQGYFLDVNPGAEKLYGYPKSAFIGRTPEFLSAPGMNDLQALSRHIEDAMNGIPQKFEFWGRKKNGEIFPKEVRLTLGTYYGQKVIIAIAQDISDRKKNEQLKEVVYQIARASQTCRQAHDFYKLISDQLCKLMNTENLFFAFLNTRKDKLIIPYMADQKDHFKETPIDGTISALVIGSGQSMLLSESQIDELERLGRIKTVGAPCRSWLGVPLFVDKEIFGVLVIQSYEHHNAFDEEDMRFLEFVSTQVAISIRHIASEERIMKLTQAVDQSRVAVIVTDADFNVEYVNTAHRRITGRVPEDVVGKPCSLLVPPHMVEGEEIRICEAIKSTGVWQGEIHLKRKDGTDYWSSVNVSQILNDNGKIINFLAMNEDVTEEKRLKQQLNQAQKMESIGTLAGGIAHDFNNLLTVVNGYAELLLEELVDYPAAQSQVVNILKSGTRAKEMTSKLLAFSRKQIFNPRSIEINHVIADQREMLQRFIGEDITIATHLTDNLPLIKADPGQIEQILMNLVVNARDAIRDVQDGRKKEISIKTAFSNLEENFVGKHPGSIPGPHILFAVSDTGTGMEKDLVEKIFDPFFTTKEQGKGTGLGLSTVYGIVKQNRGSIFIHTEKGTGSTVSVYWPVTVEPLDEEPIPIASMVAGSYPMGSELILLVEDDDDVRGFSKTLLEGKGYRVQSAADGHEAIAWVDSLSGPDSHPAMLITDMIMPGLNGKELSLILQKKIPGLKVLFTSGYANSQIVESGALLDGLYFLQKPFSIQELNKKVREILDGLD